MVHIRKAKRFYSKVKQQIFSVLQKCQHFNRKKVMIFRYRHENYT